MKRDKSISFGIVTYNSAADLSKLLQSFIEENIEKGQIYVLDNGSTDSTLEVVKKYQLDGLPLTLVPNDRNLGFGGGHNKIIASVTSTYHFVVNPDIILPETPEVQKMIQFLNSNEDVGLLSPKIVNTNGELQFLNKKDPTVFDMAIRFLPARFFKRRKFNYVKTQTGYKTTQKIDFASGAFMVFRTDVLKKVDGFDDRFFMYFEDADISRKIRQVAQSVYFPQAVVIHKWARESHHSLKMFIEQVKSMMRYFSKWGWRLF